MTLIANATGSREKFDEIILNESTRFQQISFTASSQQSLAFGNNTTLVELFCSTDCWVSVGESPTAVAASGGTSKKLYVGIVYRYGVKPGHKLAVIRDATNGVLDITEGATTAEEGPAV